MHGDCIVKIEAKVLMTYENIPEKEKSFFF